MAESEPGKEQYWAVLHFHSDDGGEVQRIVVRDTRGALAGRRVARGCERECFLPYEDEEKQKSIQTDVAG